MYCVYENVLQYFYHINKFTEIHNQNSVVREFDTPETLKVLFSLEDKIVYKSLKFFEKENIDSEVLKHIDREIDLMENLDPYQKHFVTCVMYLRIYKYTFLL